ncbi:DUF3471 domain-containing protein [Mucilaginibacter sp. OK098]|uniref:DUF3471 domain-containing protein n=1 Tax=Mucilaginibacter sp. OK098 TaxID=1855297 RepID=UPI0009177FE5|nr:DUF3471 domain-containing protein [Mucilaginibacter sp. OK098]SHM57596.1 protein of unknown function [Mucilaginibacter sp. OK098]
MKKIITLVLILFTAINTHAQLANTKWKGTLKIEEDVPAFFDFGSDTLKITRFANNAPIENMVYTITDSILTLKKTEGQSDCDNEVRGKYKIGIKGDDLSLKLLSDACEDRSSVLNNINLAKFSYPAEVKVDEAVLKQYAGIYAMNEQHKITISVENGRLMADSKTNLAAKTALYTLSEHKFSFHIGEITMEFKKGPGGIVSKFIVHENGKDYDWIKEK